eukprot:m.897803 g.897803  ORF g.897803 m.897803 type:complete len:311 (-) comp23669_c0_seq54:2883-3815(-)
MFLESVECTKNFTNFMLLFRRYTPADPPEYEIKYFNQSLDHFNFENPGTFTQRYLITTKYWGIGNAPIFVFTGAEGGDPSQFYSYSYGHPVALAKQLKGLIVFLEHRFFGKSLPFGTVDSYLPKSNRVGLLSVEQALADYASIVTHVRQTYSAESSPVVAFGGSLAGTLSTFMRIKYPAIVDIAWASSTPLLGYAGIKGINQYSWRKQVTDNFEELAPGCPDIVRRGFSGLLGATPSDVHKVVFSRCPSKHTRRTTNVSTLAGAYPRRVCGTRLPMPPSSLHRWVPHCVLGQCPRMRTLVTVVRVTGSAC